MAAEPHEEPLELRPLSLRNLGAIEEIERASYPTPWSRSMFASELAKPSSICIGAFRGSRLCGYMIISRYVDAWHVMNIAVAEEERRHGIATALLNRLFEVTAGEERRGDTPRGGGPDPRGGRPLQGSRFP